MTHKRFRTLIIGLFMIQSINAQAFTCDSIFVDSIQIQSPTELSLIASNHSPELIDYPGFILISSSGDTLAAENTNYFGIGTGWQKHLLVINSPITLPVTATLELHSWFYDTLYCSWEVILEADSIINNVTDPQSIRGFSLIQDGNMLSIVGPKDLDNLEILDMQGRLIKKIEAHEMKINKGELSGGPYIVSGTINGIRQGLGLLHSIW